MGTKVRILLLVLLACVSVLVISVVALILLSIWTDGAHPLLARILATIMLFGLFGAGLCSFVLDTIDD